MRREAGLIITPRVTGVVVGAVGQRNHQVNPRTIIKMAQCITQIRTGWDFWGEGRGVKTQYLSVLVSHLRY